MNRDFERDYDRGGFGRRPVRGSTYDRGGYERESMSGRDYPGRRGRRNMGYARNPYMPGGEADFDGRSDRDAYDPGYEDMGAYEDGEGRSPFGDEGRYGYEGTYGQGGTAQAGYGRPGGAGYGDDFYRRARTSLTGFQGGASYRPMEGPHIGRGPSSYRRSNERITEDVCERLTWSGDLDATNIDVRVEDGEVTLEGMVDSRQAKRIAEDLAESVTGVRDVHNWLRIRRAGQTGGDGAQASSGESGSSPSEQPQSGTSRRGASAKDDASS